MPVGIKKVRKLNGTTPDPAQGFIDFFGATDPKVDAHEVGKNTLVKYYFADAGHHGWKIDGQGINGRFETEINALDPSGSLLREVNAQLSREKTAFGGADPTGRVSLIDLEHIAITKGITLIRPIVVDKATPVPKLNGIAQNILYSASPNFSLVQYQLKPFLPSKLNPDKLVCKPAMVKFAQDFRRNLSAKGVKEIVLPLFSGSIFAGGNTPKEMSEWFVEGFWDEALEKENLLPLEDVVLGNTYLLEAYKNHKLKKASSIGQSSFYAYSDFEMNAANEARNEAAGWTQDPHGFLVTKANKKRITDGKNLILDMPASDSEQIPVNLDQSLLKIEKSGVLPGSSVKILFDYKLDWFHWNLGEIIISPPLPGTATIRAYDSKGGACQMEPQMVQAITEAFARNPYYQNIKLVVETTPLATVQTGVACGLYASRAKHNLKTSQNPTDVWNGIFTANGQNQAGGARKTEAQLREEDYRLVVQHRPDFLEKFYKIDESDFVGRTRGPGEPSPRDEICLRNFFAVLQTLKPAQIKEISACLHQYFTVKIPETEKLLKDLGSLGPADSIDDPIVKMDLLWNALDLPIYQELFFDVDKSKGSRDRGNMKLDYINIDIVPEFHNRLKALVAALELETKSPPPSQPAPSVSPASIKAASSAPSQSPSVQAPSQAVSTPAPSRAVSVSPAVSKPAIAVKVPVGFMPGPAESGAAAGRLYDLNDFFKSRNISLETPLHEISRQMAEAMNGAATAQGFPSACRYNGIHHALIVANFSRIVAQAMLENSETRKIIDREIDQLSPAGREFFRGKDGKYGNYLKLVGIIGLFHDTGRPSDGPDQWDASSEINVRKNIPFFLEGLPPQDRPIVEEFIKGTIDDPKDKRTNKGLMFKYPINSGDSLHSGHAFKTGFSTGFSRVYNEVPSFKGIFNDIITDVRNFVPVHGGNIDISVQNYLSQISPPVVKANFAQIIKGEFEAVRTTGKIGGKNCATMSILLQSVHGAAVKVPSQAVSVPAPSQAVSIQAPSRQVAPSVRAVSLAVSESPQPSTTSVSQIPAISSGVSLSPGKWQTVQGATLLVPRSLIKVKSCESLLSTDLYMPFVPEKSILHGTRSGLNLRVTKDIDELSSQENVVDILHSIVFLAAHSCNMTFEEVKKAGEMAKEKAGIGNVGREFQKGKLVEGKSPSETYRESEEKDFAEEDKRLAKLFTTFSARVQKLCARAGIFLGDENLGLRFNIVWEIIGKDMEQFKDVFPKKDKEAVGEELVTYNKAKEKFEAVEKQVQQEVKSHIIIAPAA